MKTKILAVILVAIGLTLSGCGTTGGTIAYQTIGATETLVYNANSGFLDSVVTGATPTNSVPTVEAAFNDTQMALHLAAVTASGGTNAPVPAAVQAKANTFISLVNSVKK